MQRPSVFVCFLLGILIILPLVLLAPQPTLAASDAYVTRYLKVTEPVPLELDAQGNTRLFSAEDLSSGKRLFEQSCLNCHVGGTTLPDPTVSLSLTALEGATPPRTSINSLVAYLREPMTYDGSEETFWCRQVPESWMQQDEIENLAAFVLRAAQKAPGWGVDNLES
ncbi:photosystem II cytochrome PsbV2 [Tychonema sp. LEGE 07199]|uniref:photosystem II cytochrome PsbV2 n=1 Tax=unclassified Tychonema TaxID=2642144 RepID=UPI001881DE76|nr:MULTISPECIES: photosystem II cytochrome PsbV2 [unclassified Tychonema]MBE9122984.1 photosystem II cytochrome PsbV2 [Tychonema sp. LEGE 07199]MBE9131377.1 photosystem II cytochrome PsbV2 [Tychonema sp. LEGE 07196]